MNPSDQDLFALLDGARTVAMVGASPTPGRPSHGVMERLLKAGYHVVPVNPQVTEVLGCAAVPTLADVRERVDIVNVFRRAEHVPELAEQALAIGARALWMQLGVVHEPAARHARAGGMLVVMDLCIAVMHSVLGVPGKVRA
jgi:predicted CoA-binding protein